LKYSSDALKLIVTYFVWNIKKGDR
jgi:hypothetical protein